MQILVSFFMLFTQMLMESTFSSILGNVLLPFPVVTTLDHRKLCRKKIDDYEWSSYPQMFN